MKLKARFKYKEHPEYGSFGLAMVGRSWADPAAGMAIAHDMLEHSPNDSGTTEEELMALGASLYVRCEEEYYRHKGSRFGAAENLASDFPQQWYYMQEAGRDTLKSPGRTTRLESYLEEILDDVVREIVKLGRSEFEPKDFPNMFRKLELQKIVGWMRKGYRKAVKRFQGVMQEELLDTFIAIEKEADKVIKLYEHEGISQGVDCIISADLSSCRASYTTCEEEYY